MEVFAWLVAALFAFGSLYGWAFFFLVGESHGAGAEIGLLSGALALIAAGCARWLRRRGL
jgi:hypothetical protein